MYMTEKNFLKIDLMDIIQNIAWFLSNTKSVNWKKTEVIP